MRNLIILSGWGWFVLALPQVTDTGVGFVAGMLLFFTGPVIGLFWVGYSLAAPGVFREPRVRWAWLSVPAAGLAPVLLAVTGWGLMARVWACEPELRAFAEEVRAGRAEVKYGDPPLRVGLFHVERAWADDGEVVLVTARGFMETFGLAYRPDRPPPPPDVRDRRLFGPWHLWYDDF